MRRLLLSNDDGVHAPGLRALHDALAPMRGCAWWPPTATRAVPAIP